MFENFRQEVKEILSERKITYATLAREIGIAENTIKCFMCGANDSRRVAEKISDALRLKLVYENRQFNLDKHRKENISE